MQAYNYLLFNALTNIKPILLLLFSILLVTTCVNSFATFEDGKIAYKNADYELALTHWEPLAEQGLAKAQFKLGVMYMNGHGVPKNYNSAFYWFAKAAEQGDMKA